MEAKNEKLITVHSCGFTATPVSIECSGKTTMPYGMGGMQVEMS